MSETLFQNVLSFAFVLVLIVVCVKGKIRWGGFLILLSSSVQSLVVTLVLLFANPLRNSGLGIGQEIPYTFLVPLAVSAAILACAILTVILGKRVNHPPAARPSKFRWLGLVGANIIAYTGLAFSLIALFSPRFFGLNAPSASYAAGLYAMTSIPVVVLLYLVSRMGGPAYPNLMRWLSFISVNGLLMYPLVFALLFIFGFPGGASRESLDCSGLIMLANIGPALLVTGLARDYVSQGVTCQPGTGTV
jgi:hypothetical protein